MALFVTVDEEAFPLLHKGAVSLVGFFPFPDLPQLLPDSVQFSQKKPLVWRSSSAISFNRASICATKLKSRSCGGEKGSGTVA